MLHNFTTKKYDMKKSFTTRGVVHKLRLHGEFIVGEWSKMYKNYELYYRVGHKKRTNFPKVFMPQKVKCPKGPTRKVWDKKLFVRDNNDFVRAEGWGIHSLSFIRNA